MVRGHMMAFNLIWRFLSFNLPFLTLPHNTTSRLLCVTRVLILQIFQFILLTPRHSISFNILIHPVILLQVHRCEHRYCFQVDSEVQCVLKGALPGRNKETKHQILSSLLYPDCRRTPYLRPRSFP